MSGNRGRIRPPRQERSRATLARLLATARDLLADTEWRELGVTDLCSRASSSVGSFYARFEGKDALLDSLAAEARSELSEVADWCREDARRRALPPASKLRQLTAALARYAERQHGVLRALAVEGRPLPWQDRAVRDRLMKLLSGNDTPPEKSEAALGILLAACAAGAAGIGDLRSTDPEALATMLSLYLGNG